MKYSGKRSLHTDLASSLHHQHGEGNLLLNFSPNEILCFPLLLAKLMLKLKRLIFCWRCAFWLAEEKHAGNTALESGKNSFNFWFLVFFLRDRVRRESTTYPILNVQFQMNRLVTLIFRGSMCKSSRCLYGQGHCNKTLAILHHFLSHPRFVRQSL